MGVGVEGLVAIGIGHAGEVRVVVITIAQRIAGTADREAAGADPPFRRIGVGRGAGGIAGPAPYFADPGG
jgi:hypothetical protein